MVTSSASKYCLFPFYYARVDLVHIGELCDLCHICINKFYQQSSICVICVIESLLRACLMNDVRV